MPNLQVTNNLSGASQYVGDGTSNSALSLRSGANSYVGIGTVSPQDKLHIDGGSIQLSTDQTQLFFLYDGQIQSQDEYHRIIFRPRNAVNTMEFREWGDLLFTPGARLSNLTPKVVMKDSGNVGVGCTSPGSGITLLGTGPTAMVEITGGMIFSENSSNRSIIIAPPPSGDTSGATDTANIQACINALPYSASAVPPVGGTVVLQSGTYTVCYAGTHGGEHGPEYYAIEVKAGVNIVGSSISGTVLQVASNAGNLSVLSVQQVASSSGQWQFPKFAIKDLCILANGRPEITGVMISGYDSNVSDTITPQPVFLQNLWIDGCATGVKVRSWFTELENCYIKYCTTGIDLSNEFGTIQQTNATLVNHCNVWGSTTGIHIEGFGNVVTASNIGIPSNGCGIKIENVPSTTYLTPNYIAGNYIEHVDTNQVNVTGINDGAGGSTIIGNNFDIITSGSTPIIYSAAGGNTSIGNLNRSGSNSVPLDIVLATHALLNLQHDNQTEGQNSQVNWFAKDSDSSHAYDYVAGLRVQEDTLSAGAFKSRLQLRVRDGSGSLVDTMVVDGRNVSGGAVGIGVTNPMEKLEVNGDIKFGTQGVKISTGTADPRSAPALLGNPGDLYVRKAADSSWLYINSSTTTPGSSWSQL